MHAVKLSLIVTLTCAVVASCVGPAGTSVDVVPAPAFISDNPDAIYAADPNNSWNRIFRALFTRTIKHRLSDAFPEGAPFVQVRVEMGSIPLRISKEQFSRTEIGDRAIEPLYPTFLTIDGPLQALSEPRFSDLTTALREAIDETRDRSPVERALMQADVWAAYDILYARRTGIERAGADHSAHNAKLLDLLRHFVRKLALSSEEITSLKNNYLVAVTKNKLPNLFSTNSGWLEIELLPHRLHDDTTNYRRAARVFVKPRATPADPAQFVESLKHNQEGDKVEAVALVVQNLLIDKSGRVVPSPLFADVQFRFFANDRATGAVSAKPQQLELSRRKLLTEPISGGFVEFSATSRAYLTSAGNDYDFATPIQEADAPVVVPLRTRCTQCHAGSLTHLMTYSIHYIPPVPTVRILKPENQERVFYVARLKEEREDFKSLFTKSTN